MRKINDINAELQAARANHHELVSKDAERERAHRASHEQVKKLTQELSAAIAEGAKPCPWCGGAAHGMRQEVGRGKQKWVEFEVGCLACPSKKMEDGTTRKPSARGRLQKHAVEAWNAGPEAWSEVTS